MQQQKIRPLQNLSTVDIRREIRKLLFTAGRDLNLASIITQTGYVTLADIEGAISTAMHACHRIHVLVEELHRRDKAMSTAEDDTPIIVHM